MPKFSVRVSDFQGAYASINCSKELAVSKQRCLKFASSIGLPILKAATPSSEHAMAMASYKALAIKCATCFTEKYLSRPKEYRKMDPSEKANISFWTGMTFAAILADEFLDVPRLVHATAFGRRRLARVDPKSRRLADLVGNDTSGAWHIVEAKARQDKQYPKTFADWKAQAQTVKTIDGVAPSTRSYSFTRVGGTYSATLVDPSPDDTRPGVHMRFEPHAILEGYYGPFVEWLSANTHAVRRGDYTLRLRLAAFDPVDAEFVYIGMVEEVLETLRRGDLHEPLRALDTEDSYIGRDGIAVLTSTQGNLE